MIARSLFHRISMLGTGLVLVASMSSCQAALDPGDTLNGRWANSDAALVADRDSIVFLSRCERAVLPPVTLDANRAFAADSRTFTISGNIFQLPGEQIHLQGEIIDGSISLQLYVVGGGGGSDPVDMTLTPTRALPALVCTA